MSIYKRGEIWWMDVRVGGSRRRLRKSTGTADEVQARMIEQAAVAVNRGLTTRARARTIIDMITPDESLAIRDIGPWYEKRLADEHATPSRLEMQRRMSVIGKACAWIIDNTRCATADDVTDEVAWQFATAYERERQISVKTRNNMIGELRTAWEMLIKHGKATANPWTRARGARQIEQETHGRAFTGFEIKRILAAAKEIGCEWEGVVTVALYTGLRKRDVETLRWAEVDETFGVIRKTPSKTARRGIRVTIPMHDEVRRVIAAAEHGGEYVFPWRAAHPNGQRPKPGDHFFADVLKAANIEEREGEHVTFHCLRHTFVTRLAEAGVAQDVRMRLAGHTNAATNDLYTHDDVSARAAIRALA